MCRGCGSCAGICPDGAITGLVHKPYRIDHTKCSNCGKCMEVCNFDAIRQVEIPVLEPEAAG